MRLSPGPISWSAGSRKAIASTSDSDSSTTSFSRCPSSVRGRWIPGVSTSTICALSVVRMPRMALRVVSGRDEAMAICVPISALISVDLPTFGRPTTATKPERYGTGASASECWEAGSVTSASVMLVLGILVVMGCLFGTVRMVFVLFSFVHALDVGRFHHDGGHFLGGVPRSRPRSGAGPW